MKFSVTTIKGTDIIKASFEELDKDKGTLTFYKEGKEIQYSRTRSREKVVVINYVLSNVIKWRPM